MNSGFNWLDYTVLISYCACILFVASMFIKEQKSLNHFFMASRQMPWLAVGCSILASLLSAISITGVPAEYWQNGFSIFGNPCGPNIHTQPFSMEQYTRNFLKFQVFMLKFCDEYRSTGKNQKNLVEFAYNRNNHAFAVARISSSE